MESETYAQLPPSTILQKSILPDGTIIYIEVTPTSLEMDAGANPLPFQNISQALEGIVSSVSETLKRLQPQKATVTFGMSVTLEAGRLTALLVKGSGEANLTITLEWDKTIAS